MKLVQIGHYWINPAHVIALIPAAVDGTRIVMVQSHFDVLNPPDDVAALLNSSGGEG